MHEEDRTVSASPSFLTISLTKAMQDKGGDLWYQDIFAEVSIYETQQTLKSKIIEVDKTDFSIPKPEGVKVVTRNAPEQEKGEDCGQKYCIKKGDKNELIREINIRLAGFGGNVPTDEFTDRTEKMIKQFQRDYMKVPETGRICGNVLKAIDEFQSKYIVDINQAKCPCSQCSGFGNGKFPEQKQNSNVAELYRKYEYPGIHRSLMWTLRAIQFYLATYEKGSKLRVGKIHSGYRCNIDNKNKGRGSTNHMGKALDIHIYGLKDSSTIEPNCDKVRDLLVKYSNAKYRWGEKNVIALEPSTRNRIGKEFIATIWVHYDVRTFGLEYLQDKYFVTSMNGVNGKSMVTLAKELGFTNTCNCLGTTIIQKKEGKTKDDRVDPKTLKATDKIKEFIKSFEGFKSKPYDDTEGYATIGYGYLIAYKSYTKVTQVDIAKTEITWKEFTEGVSRERALELFNKKVAIYEKSIYRDVTVPLYQHEFDALVSLVFNTGPDFLKEKVTKAPKLRSNLMDKKYEEAAKEFLDITNGGTSGLINRRNKENKIFLHNIYENNK